MVTSATASEIGRHKCLIYDGHPSEQLPIVVPFLAEGLGRNRRALYLGPPEMVAMVGSALTGWGVHTAQEIRRGSLQLSSDRSYLAGGRFDPRQLVDALRQLTDQAIADGYDGVTASGDMMWELGTERNFLKLLEYETLLDDVFQDLPLEGICQYRRGAVPASAIQEALMTHPGVYIGTVHSSNNPFYFPPNLASDMAGVSRREEHGSWMCRQIVKVELKMAESATRLKTAEDEASEHRRYAERLAELNRGLELQLGAHQQELERLRASSGHAGEAASTSPRS